ncbi:MAG TPA: dihydrolipoamide acetyltransferase family protein [Actinoplanes sp.]|jgi:2-oxoglutarate dehydrogenase E2 component (dihydrolipoamide succinyltransferase)
MADDINEVSMPKLGESVTEGTLSAWLKEVGEPVAFDDPLFEVSTDKVDSEIPSPFDGVLLEVLVAPGDTVPVGTLLARIGPAGAEIAGEHSPVDESVAPPGEIKAPAEAPSAPPKSGNGRVLSPAVRRLAAENNLDLATVAGTGGGGRIMREDVLAAVAAVDADRPIAVDRPTPAGRAEVLPMSRVRLVTAERMIESRRTAAHVWTSIEVDLEAVEHVRQRHKAAFRKAEGASLTYLPFIARAVCDGLLAFPPLNSSIDLPAKTITLHHYVNLGIAVDVPGFGLMAPVIRDADALNLRGLARAVRDVGTRAKDRKLGSAELTGSTFTISNPGPIGTYASAAVINQPNVAILTTEGVARRVVAVGDAIAVHHTCVLGLSYDHRALDGVVAAQFLAYVRDALQDRDWEADLG